MVLGAASVSTFFIVTSCSKKPNPSPIPPVQGESYYTLSSNPSQHIYFTESNTNISNFYATVEEEATLPIYNNNSIKINEQEVPVNSICSLYFGSSYGDVSSIEDGWLAAGESDNSFSSLTSIDFSGLSSLSSVGAGWLYGVGANSFAKLSSIDFSGLSSLSRVGENWLNSLSEDCFSSLSEIDFEDLSSLSRVGAGWLYGVGANSFAKLSSINFEGLSNLSIVATNWLYGGENSFSSLSEIDFEDLSSLSSVGAGWLYGAGANSFAKLSSIDFSGLSSLSSVGYSWLHGEGDDSFSSLSSIIVSSTPFYSSVAPENFAAGTVNARAGTIYGSKASSWKAAGLTNWNIDPPQPLQLQLRNVTVDTPMFDSITFDTFGNFDGIPSDVRISYTFKNSLTDDWFELYAVFYDDGSVDCTAWCDWGEGIICDSDGWNTETWSLINNTFTYNNKVLTYHKEIDANWFLTSVNNEGWNYATGDNISYVYYL